LPTPPSLFTLKREAHDRPRRRPACHLNEAGLAEAGGEAGPREGRRHAARSGVDRVAFEDRGAARPCELRGGLEQPHGHAAAPQPPRHEEAHDRPDRLIIHALQRPRSLQDRIALPRPDRAPGNRLAPGVGQESGDRAGVHQALESPADCPRPFRPRTRSASAATTCTSSRRKPPGHRKGARDRPSAPAWPGGPAGHRPPT
jgi:hypothetical protein